MIRCFIYLAWLDLGKFVLKSMLLFLILLLLIFCHTISLFPSLTSTVLIGQFNYGCCFFYVTFKCEQRVDILTKLISMAVALQCSSVLECAAVWMQVALSLFTHMTSIVVF